MFSTCSKSIQVILQNSVNICEMWCFSTIRTVVKLSLTSSQSTPANPKQQLLQTGNSEQMLYIWPQFAVSCFTEDFWFSFCLFVWFFVFFKLRTRLFVHVVGWVTDWWWWWYNTGGLKLSWQELRHFWQWQWLCLDVRCLRTRTGALLPLGEDCGKCFNVQ